MQYTSTLFGTPASSARFALTCNCSNFLTVSPKSNFDPSFASRGAVKTSICLELQHGVHRGTLCSFARVAPFVSPRAFLPADRVHRSLVVPKP